MVREAEKMKPITFTDLQRLSRICGFSLSRVGTRYELKTPYATYQRTTLREIDSIIRKDSHRMETSRF